MKLFITGAAGYIGGLIAEQFARRDDIEEVIVLDRRNCPPSLVRNDKILWIRANTADSSWQDVVASRRPDIAIHCAWQIREFYFRKKTHHRWNIEGSKNLFQFIFKTPSIKKLIYFSSVSVYGAYPDNSVEKPFVEADPMREAEYLYGVQKKLSEEELRALYAIAHQSSGKDSVPSVTVLRVSSVTGPRYATAKRGMTLQNILARIPYIPIANPEWGRQFVQESDLLAIVNHIFESSVSRSVIPSGERNPDDMGRSSGSYYSVFNIAPQGFMKSADIVKSYGKKALYVPKEALRAIFFVLRHLSLGHMPTSRGGWKFYAFPLAVDGSAVTRAFEFEYGGYGKNN